jgi:hypothetical protein
MSHKPDWDGYAVKQANRARALTVIDRRVVPRGIPEPGPLELKPDATGELVPWPDVSGLGIAVIHGHDGYLQNPRARARVYVLQQILTRLGIEVLGFGTDNRKRAPGRAWALVVRSDDVHLLSRALEAAHSHVVFHGTPFQGVASACFADLGLDREDFPFDLGAFAG